MWYDILCTLLHISEQRAAFADLKKPPRRSSASAIAAFKFPVLREEPLPVPSAASALVAPTSPSAAVTVPTTIAAGPSHPSIPPPVAYVVYIKAKSATNSVLDAGVGAVLKAFSSVHNLTTVATSFRSDFKDVTFISVSPPDDLNTTIPLDTSLDKMPIAATSTTPMSYTIILNRDPPLSISVSVDGAEISGFLTKQGSLVSQISALIKRPQPGLQTLNLSIVDSDGDEVSTKWPDDFLCVSDFCQQVRARIPITLKLLTPARA